MDIDAEGAPPTDVLPGDDSFGEPVITGLSSEAIARNLKRACTDKVMTAIQTQARRKFGTTDYLIGDEASKLLVGIPMPSLAFEFLIGLDKYPLGLVWQLLAFPGVGKSALLAEIANWFYMAAGNFWLVHNEDKFNPLWYRSILPMGLYDTGVNQLFSKTLEEMQQHVVHSMNIVKKQIRVNKAYGQPFLFGVDSIMGKRAEGVQEKILGVEGKDGLRTNAAGNAVLGFPVEANKLSTWISTVAGHTSGWPFSLVLINQLKEKQDENGNKQRHSAGGSQVKFQEAFELELSRPAGPNFKFSNSNFIGYPVDLQTFKNSFYEGNRKIKTRLLWKFNDDGKGGQYQRTVWDWHWSTTWLLNQVREAKGYEYQRPRLAAAGIHVESVKSGDAENLAWSRTLGMKESDSVPWATLGRRIASNPEMVAAIRHALCIQPVTLLDKNYMKQVSDAVKKAE